jgi:hypothetical protein
VNVKPAERRYRTFVSDSARWTGFEFRPGDIVITTPAKCGTTWTQMICALLIFQTPEFDRPLAEITPWLDMQTRHLDSVFADLAAQQHRRFIKTHTPIDGIPLSDQIVYISVMRDPRDVGISMDNHILNSNMESFFMQRVEVAGLDDVADFFPDGLPERGETPVERFWYWVDNDTAVEKEISSLKGTLGHLDVAWPRRDHSNVILLHYSDLKTDLEGQMRALAHRLGIEVGEAKWPELVNAASFDYMKQHADRIVPNSTQDLWQATGDFFRHGTSGQWCDILADEASITRYNTRVAELTTPELAAWAHRG